MHSINSKQLGRFRDRLLPSGYKDDRRNALLLAYSLRTASHCLRAMQAPDPQVMRLRGMSHICEELVGECTKLVNRIRQELWHYYPQFYDLVGSQFGSWHLELWERVSPPHSARRIHLSTIEVLLKRDRFRRFEAA